VFATGNFNKTFDILVLQCFIVVGFDVLHQSFVTINGLYVHLDAIAVQHLEGLRSLEYVNFAGECVGSLIYLDCDEMKMYERK